MKTHIKYLALSAALSVMLAISCTEDKQAKLKEDEEKQRSEVAYILRIKDSIENISTQTLWEIDRNLQVINEKEGTIMLGPGSNVEKGISPKERILRNIKVINTLMEENKKKIADLDQKLKRYKFSNEAILKLVDEAQDKIKLQEERIASMKNEIIQKEFDLAALQLQMNESEKRNQMLQELSLRYQNDVNTAYYVCGSSTELKKEGILIQNKGLLAIAQKEKINTDLPDKNFTKIDIREVDRINLNAKKVKLLSSHPEGSYELKKENGGIACLEIKDPEQFWKISKYAVIELKK